jgi:hypothetical protein
MATLPASVPSRPLRRARIPRLLLLRSARKLTRLRPPARRQKPRKRQRRRRFAATRPPAKKRPRVLLQRLLRSPRSMLRQSRPQLRLPPARHPLQTRLRPRPQPWRRIALPLVLRVERRSNRPEPRRLLAARQRQRRPPPRHHPLPHRRQRRPRTAGQSVRRRRRQDSGAAL